MKLRGILALALTFAWCGAALTQDGSGTSLFKLSSFVTATQVTSNQNNYTATDGTNTCASRQVLRISTDASRNITGLSCGQVEGALRIIHNVGSFSAILTNQDAASTAANRFLFGADTTLATNTSITVRYDATAQRWRAITTPGSGGGGGSVTSVTAGVGLSGGVITTSGTINSYLDANALTNCTLAASVASNNLTVSLKTQSGADPSASVPCWISFRSATLATGDYTAVAVTAATAVVFNSGSTLGTANNTPFLLWVTAWNNAGTVALGLSKQSTSSGQIYPLVEHLLQSTTACAACAGATSAGVFYTPSALSSKAMRIAGFMEWGSGLTTAGTWASGPTRIQMFGPGVPRPGVVIQSISSPWSTNFSCSGTCTTPTFLATGQSVSISPTMASSLINVTARAPLGQTIANKGAVVKLYRGSTALTGSQSIYNAGGLAQLGQTIYSSDAPGTTSSTAYQTW
ncbi:MAG: hypothetical protein PS018_20255, partial [bacterium]|nr:hypothetical protein [bacterium]